jgi:lipopolysaccharide exporter
VTGSDLRDAPHSAHVSMRRSAVVSFLWAALSMGGGRILVFLSTLVLARLLTPQQFGLVAAGLTIVTYLEIGLDLGVGSSLVYEQETSITRRVQTAFTLNIIMAVVLTALGVLAVPEITRFFHTPRQETLFRVLFLYLMIRGAGQIQDAVLKRDLRFRQRTLSELAGGIVRAATSIALASTGYGPWSIVWGLLAGALITTVAKWFQTDFVPRLWLDVAATRSLLRFGLAFVALHVLSTVSDNFDYLAVGNRLGTGQLGYYTMSYRLPELIIANVYWIISAVAFPLYSKARQSAPEAFRSAVLRVLRLVTLFGFTAGAGLAIVSRDAVLVLFSPRWEPAIAPMILISLALGLTAVEYASGDIFPAIGRPGLLVTLNIPLAGIKLVGFLFAAPYGIAAVAAVHLCFSALYAVIRLAVANRVVGIRLREDLAAMAPAAWGTAGIVACALPVRVLTEPGLGALLATVLAGVIGGALAVAFGARSTLGELRVLVHDIRRR